MLDLSFSILRRSIESRFDAVTFDAIFVFNHEMTFGSNPVSLQ